MEKKTSRLPNFYTKSQVERLELLKNFSSLSQEDITLLERGLLTFESANRMVENVVGLFSLPFGIATNFIINEKETLVPMVTEEASVIAAASYGAKLARTKGGFTAKVSEPIMIGQVQLVRVPDSEKAVEVIKVSKRELLAYANEYDPVLVKVGGGVRDIVPRVLQTSRGVMVIVDLLVHVCDAMGANVVIGMAERIAGRLEKLTGGKALLRIVSNLAVHRTVKASAVWAKEDIGGEVIEGILDAYAFAQADPFRCATHNKGIMNGVDAVAIATGNDFRALEAGAHNFRGVSPTRGVVPPQRVEPLTHYYTNEDGDLVGEIEMPVVVGTVGGITKVHPGAALCLKILNVSSAGELGVVLGAVGLAQNFAALRALVDEGILQGHMKLHSKNIAITAGVPKDFVDRVAQQMVDEDNVSVGRAQEIYKKFL